MKTGPRTYSLGGGISALETRTLGGNGVLPGGTYFLAITSASGTFASTFSAFSIGAATVNTAQLNFRFGSGSPVSVISLGAISDTQPAYATPDVSITFGGFADAEVKWFMFTFTASDDSKFLDIDTTTVGMVPAAVSSIDTRIALYDSTGKFVISDDNNGQGSYSRLSFGNSTGTRTVHGCTHVNLTIGE